MRHAGDLILGADQNDRGYDLFTLGRSTAG